MRKLLLPLAMSLMLCCLSAATTLATPTHQIRIPSTDVQPYLTGRLTIENYFRASGAKNTNFPGGRDPNLLNIGVTAGVLPFRKLQLELGFDYLVTANDPNDQHPWSGNIKLATPEDALFRNAPALAVGLYNGRPVKDIATPDAPRVYSGQNLIYALAAKTLPEMGSLPSLGRFSAGYYRGSKRALVNTRGEADNDGVLLSWDRVMRELSDQLWFGVDYMGGDNIDGSLNFGFTWSFTKDVVVLLGYDIYKRNSLAGSNTLTTQLSVNFP